MSPQWIPQNIQKRLLLYVLKQLSLFSEVDLPNLEEVSLNNITLKDVTLDPEKVGKLPGCNFRHGKLGSMEMTTISGISGVKIDVKNAEVVVSPDFDEPNFGSSSQFSLARSTANLAETIMFDLVGEEAKDERKEDSCALDSDSDEDDANYAVFRNDVNNNIGKSRRTSTSTRRRSSTVSNKSALGGVMQKAVEMALSRLQVYITNLSIKLITESTDLLIQVDEVSVNTVNGLRTIGIRGVKVVTLRPIINPGKHDAGNNNSTNEVNHNTKPEKFKPENSDSENEEIENEEIENEENEGVDYGEESLMDSMVFTHEEASSIYMSATAHSLPKPSNAEGNIDNKLNDKTTKGNTPILLYLNECEVSFEGLQTISNLEIEVDKVNIAASPGAATLISIFNGFTKTLQIKRRQKRMITSKRNSRGRDRFPQYTNEDDTIGSMSNASDGSDEGNKRGTTMNVEEEEEEEEKEKEEGEEGENSEGERGLNDEIDDGADSIFSKMAMRNINISLDSAIEATGEFASATDNVVIELYNINIKHRDELLLYGGIESIIINHFKEKHIPPSSIFYFENSKNIDRSDRSASPQSVSSTTSTNSSYSKADLRFECFQSSDDNAKLEVTCLLGKPSQVNLNLTNIIAFASFSSKCQDAVLAIKQFIASYEILNTPRVNMKPTSTKPTQKKRIILQTGSTSMSVAVKNDLKIGLHILPAKYDSEIEEFSVPAIHITSSIENKMVENIISISNVNFLLKSQSFTAFLQPPNENFSPSYVLPLVRHMISSMSLKISEITCSISPKTLKKIYKCLQDFTLEISKSLESNETQSTNMSTNSRTTNFSHSRGLERSSLMTSSVRNLRRSGRGNLGGFGGRSGLGYGTSGGNNFRSGLTNRKAFNHSHGYLHGYPNRHPHGHATTQSKTNSVLFNLNLRKLSITLKDIVSDFGTAHVELSDVAIFKTQEEWAGSILNLDVFRRSQQPFVNESILAHYRKEPLAPNTLPLILMKLNLSDKSSTLEMTCREFLLEYRTHWLSFFGKDESIIEVVEEEFVDVSLPSPTSQKQKFAVKPDKNKRFDIRCSLYGCMVGLTPGRLSCKSFVTIGSGEVSLVFTASQFYIKSSVRDLHVLLIDDVKNASNSEDSKASDANHSGGYVDLETAHVDYIINQGYITAGYVNIAHVGFTFNTNVEEIKQRNKNLGIRDHLSIIDFKLNVDDIQLNFCADSFNTFTQLLSDLKLPYEFLEKDKIKVSLDQELDITENVTKNMYHDEAVEEGFIDLDNHKDAESDNFGNLAAGSASGLNFQEEYFSASYTNMEDEKADPLTVSVNLTKMSLYLYDGYDWKDTRKAIRKVVKDIEKEQQGKPHESKALTKANTHTGTQTNAQANANMAVNSRNNDSPNSSYSDYNEGHNSNNGLDLLEQTIFQSIHVSAPRLAEDGMVDLTHSINLGMQNDTNGQMDDDEELKIKANIRQGKNYKNLKLRRSNDYKVAIDLMSIDLRIVVYSTRDPRRDETDPNMKFETLSMLDISVGTVDVLDNVPSSTWNKFLSYMNSLGEREIGTSMLKMNIVNERPQPSLVAAEAIAKVSILPLRLHIDQDTLDFLTRFFDFKDSRFELPPDEILYVQKLEIDPIKLKVDYKPKKVDYNGLRSGKSGEFANFFVLDAASLTLPKAQLYGLSGMSEIGRGLGTAWAPVFKSNQVLGIISGVSSLRSIVNVGSGFRNLYVVSKKEYQKDGRVWRSLQKGTKSFAKTTGYELVNLGVKLASGTQVLLEQGEELFGGEGSSVRNAKPLRRRSDSSDDGSLIGNLLPTPSDNLMVSSELMSKAASKYAEKYKFSRVGSGAEERVRAKDTSGSKSKSGNVATGGDRLYSHIDFDDGYESISSINKELNQGQSIFFLAPSDANDRNQINGLFEDAGDDTNDEDEDAEAFEVYAFGSGRNKKGSAVAESADNDDDDEEEEEGVEGAIEEEDEEVEVEELRQKMISLYSNQPETMQQGFKSAYKSLGTNFKVTQKQLKKLKRDLEGKETVQDTLLTVLKSSPIILIRPVIGTTEAIAKTLMGIGNVIDSKHIVENKDKYRSESKE
ncbi:autophagy- protein 2 [Lodderomyces elongisporus]|uniref:autophagy- protein 2 n=1 Tax=Lodderomyces elongisporus TaxID=36914 RepID=UPI0029214752|nr:autophagy- protein 2 [Lodderomyces elongisporus]WLF77240.1 autophagy- protein 2 [Lodderomyces elongisporus]